MQSPPDMNRALLEMQGWPFWLLRSASEKFNFGCVVRDLGTHGPLWAFVESLESSKI